MTRFTIKSSIFLLLGVGKEVITNTLQTLCESLLHLTGILMPCWIRGWILSLYFELQPGDTFQTWKIFLSTVLSHLWLRLSLLYHCQAPLMKSSLDNNVNHWWSQISPNHITLDIGSSPTWCNTIGGLVILGLVTSQVSFAICLGFWGIMHI